MRLRWKVGSVAALTAVVAAWLALRSTRVVAVTTSSAAFVSSRFEITPDGMRVLLEVTPDKEPAEAGKIYDAATRGVPVVVSVPYRGGVVSFRVIGVTGDGEFVVPCKAREECARILEANRFELPVQLERP